MAKITTLRMYFVCRLTNNAPHCNWNVMLSGLQISLSVLWILLVTENESRQTWRMFVSYGL